MQFWSLFDSKDMIKLDLKRFTWILTGLESLSYKERFGSLGQGTVYVPEAKRRLKGNMIEVNKMMKGIVRIKCQGLLSHREW